MLVLHPLLQGDDSRFSSDAAGPSRKRAKHGLRSRTVCEGATGSGTVTDEPAAQLAACIPDVDRACVTMKEAIGYGKHYVVGASKFCRHH